MPETIYGMNAASMQRTIRAVKKIEKANLDLTGYTPGKNFPSVGFWAKITAMDTSTPPKFSWQKMQTTDTGGLAAQSDATGDTNAFEVNGFPCPQGLVVWLTYGGAGFYQFSTAAEIFPVKVTVDGGSAGSMSGGTNCSFTYTVFAEDGTTQLGTTKTPDVTRYMNCQYDTPGDKSPGIAYYDVTGGLHLYSVAKEKPTGKVVTALIGWQISGLNIQTNSQNFLVLDNGDPTGWTTAATGTNCS